MEINLVAHNAALSACEKAKRWQNALALLEQLPEKRLVPDDVSDFVGVSGERNLDWKVRAWLELFIQNHGTSYIYTVYNCVDIYIYIMLNLTSDYTESCC